MRISDWSSDVCSSDLEKLTQLVSTIGENMSLRRMTALAVDPGVVASYMHNAVAPGLGKIGVLVALESTGDAQKLGALGRQIALRSDERRVGKECVSTGRSRGSP